METTQERKQVSLPNLSVLAYANNFTIWHYKTDDLSVESEGYFDKTADMMNVNDLMIVQTPLGLRFYRVAEKSKDKIAIAFHQ